MYLLREQLLILLSTPAYAIAIGVEVLLSNFRGKGYYTLKGTLYNIYLMLLNMALDFLMLGVGALVLGFFYGFRIFSVENAFLYWTLLVLSEDFMYYLLHYVDHYVRFFWAVHVTHHSSEEFNLTVGFRSSVFQPLYRFIYFIPLALVGFRPLDIVFIYSVTQIYGILIHTQVVGRLGFLEWFLSTPSHHRVHHGSNPQYLDKNMGMVLIIWDRLFGTFQPEMDTVPVRYGLTKNLEKETPATVVFHEWHEMLRDLRKPVPFKVKLKYLFGPPGWSHDGSRKTSKQMLEELKAEKSRRMWTLWSGSRPYWSKLRKSA